MEELLRQLAAKYNVSVPRLVITETPRLGYYINGTIYLDPRADLKVLLHEFFHHVIREKRMPAEEVLVNILTERELGEFTSNPLYIISGGSLSLLLLYVLEKLI